MKKLLIIMLLVLNMASLAEANYFIGGGYYNISISDPKTINTGGLALIGGVRQPLIGSLYGVLGYEADYYYFQSKIGYYSEKHDYIFNHNVTLGLGYPIIRGENGKSPSLFLELGGVYSNWQLEYINKTTDWGDYLTNVSNSGIAPFVRLGLLGQSALAVEYRFGDNKTIPSGFVITYSLQIFAEIGKSNEENKIGLIPKEEEVNAKIEDNKKVNGNLKIKNDNSEKPQNSQLVEKEFTKKEAPKRKAKTFKNKQSKVDEAIRILKTKPVDETGGPAKEAYDKALDVMLLGKQLGVLISMPYTFKATEVKEEDVIIENSFEQIMSQLNIFNDGSYPRYYIVRYSINVFTEEVNCIACEEWFTNVFGKLEKAIKR